MFRTCLTVIGILGAGLSSTVYAQPIEYVRVCDIYGVGYFYIPGTETCVNVATGETRKESNSGTIVGQTDLALRQSAIEARINGAFQQSAISNALEDPDLVAGERFGLRINWGAAGQANALGLTGTAVIADGLFDKTGRLAISGGVAFGGSEVGGRAGLQLTW